jgi:TPR repeat protein
MHAYIRMFFCSFLLFISFGCETQDSDDQFSRAERAYKKSGPMAGAATYLHDARRGDPKAAFYVGTFYVIEAAQQRNKGISDSAVKSLENTALTWYNRAATGGNVEARLILEAVQRSGRRMLYISIEHAFDRQHNPEYDFSRYHKIPSTGR